MSRPQNKPLVWDKNQSKLDKERDGPGIACGGTCSNHLARQIYILHAKSDPAVNEAKVDAVNKLT
jgi:hypothetical protein